MNKMLHALSNRSGPFNDPVFGSRLDFQPHPETSEERDLRERMFLKITHTDYYLKNYLQLVRAYPELARRFEETAVSYIPELAFPRGLMVSGAEFISGPNDYGVFTDPATEVLPMALTYAISYKSNSEVLITIRDFDHRVIAPCVINGTDPNKVLRIDWPENIPFKGALRLRQNWNSVAAVVLLETFPSRFPYAAVLRRFESHPFLGKLLINFNVIDAFHGAFDPAEKMAIALTVLGLSNTAVYPPA